MESDETQRRDPAAREERADHRRGGIVVEIVGPAGVGKSVVAPLVVVELRRRLGDDRVVRFAPDAATSDIGRAARVMALVGAPAGLLAAWRMPPAAKAGRLLAFRRWGSVFATMRAARQRLRRGARLCVVEQGPVHYLRETTELGRLPAFALPEVVVEVTAHPATVLERRLARDKPRRAAELLRGDTRVAQATRLASRLADVPEARARELLARWSETFCAPSLRPDELDAAFDRGRNHTPREHPDDHWSRATIRTRLRERVCWESVSNDTGADIDEVAARAADVIVRRLGTRP